jgi:poly-gamma-glutamate synthesis protein (capsule biosynthesis protein)
MNLVLLGDVMLGRLVNKVLHGQPPDYPWGDTLPLFRAADWRVCNLECVLSDRGRPWSATPKVFHFRSDARNVAVLQAADIDAVSLANNHTLDYEYDALFEMLDILDRAGIGHAGAGATFADASRLAVCERKGTRLGIIAFSNNEPTWEAGERKPGIFYSPIDVQNARAGKLLEVVRHARNTVDLLLVSAHWGPNWGYRPQPPHIPFGRALIDAGADVVFGHSGHVFQGIEIYHGRPILYCTGNFVDDYAVDEIERNDQSFVYRLETEESVIQHLWLYPTVIRDCQARRASLNEAQQIATKMQTLCTELGTRSKRHEEDGCLEIAVG